MYKLEDIKDVHLELTSKCQARCPMCPRRINGGILNPLISLDEIDLETFKNWFSDDFIKQLDSLFMCGNLGDPIIAQDCLLILEHIRAVNPNIRLSMHTNGSARTADFWRGLAAANVRVVFGIDGSSKTHSLYRVGTDFDQILRNASSFINAGGHAEWHMLAFQHNGHEAMDARNVAHAMGFKEFQVKHTSRFVNGKFHALDEQGRTTHILYPTERSRDMIVKVIENYDSATISCKAKNLKQIYVSANGNVSPCCWLDLSWQLPKQENRIEYMDTVGEFPNLNNTSLQEIFDSGFFDRIENNPLLECKKQCGTFDKFGEQFV